jgi:hypothetical protein
MQEFFSDLLFANVRASAATPAQEKGAAAWPPLIMSQGTTKD